MAGGGGRRERRHASRTAAVRNGADQRRDRSSRLLRHGRGHRRRVRPVSRADLRAEGALRRRPRLCRTRHSPWRDHLRHIGSCGLSGRGHHLRSWVEHVHGHASRHNARHCRSAVARDPQRAQRARRVGDGVHGRRRLRGRRAGAGEVRRRGSAFRHPRRRWRRDVGRRLRTPAERDQCRDVGGAFQR